jgi:phosphoribosylglycinamide formyltransferase 1
VHSQSRLRVCAAISGRATVLRAVLEAAQQDLLPLEFCGFVADRQCDGFDVAKKFNIPSSCLDYKSFPSRGDFNEAFDATVLSFTPDLLLLHYDRLVSGRLLSALPEKVINTHYSLLPAFTGFRAISRALETGVRFSGVTIHVVTERVDDGPILAQAVCPIQPGDTAATLGFRLFAAAVPLTLGLLATAPNLQIDNTNSEQFSLPDGSEAMLSVALSSKLRDFADKFVGDRAHGNDPSIES